MRLLSNLHVKGKPAVLPDHAICRQSHYFIYRPHIFWTAHFQRFQLKQTLRNKDQYLFRALNISLSLCKLTEHTEDLFFLTEALGRLRDSTIYKEYISFCGLAGSRSCCNEMFSEFSSCWKPCSRIGLVGRRVRISHTRRDKTWALVWGIWCWNNTKSHL